MSYCRFSCDNFKSDVYLYYSVGGVYVCHIAGNRIVEELPPDPTWDVMNGKIGEAEFKEKSLAWREAMDKCTRVPIVLPHAGETIQHDSAEDMLTCLRELKELGYRVPEHAISRLKEEIDEERENA